MPPATDEYARRRAAFIAKMGDGVAIFPAAPEQVRSNDGDYPYRQDSDFFYLTGFEEPRSVLVLAPNNAEAQTTIFLRAHDREREVWEGARLGVEGAAAELGLDAAHSIEDFWTRLPGLLESSDNLYYGFNYNDDFNRRITELVAEFRAKRRRADSCAINVLDPSMIAHEMRIFKTPYEIERLRRAVNVSVEGHIAAMRHVRPGMHEYEIQALVEYVFTSRGAQSAAYSSIVGSGDNANCLHYRANRRRIGDRDLVLVDAGAEVDYYCGDITRTWPASGKFTPEQRAVYEVVLRAQNRVIELCKPGVRWNTEVHDACVRVLVEGMLDIGVMTGSADEIIEKEAYKPYYMHRQGHYLGLDVHDVGNYKVDGQWRALEPGMVMTVEPGLYIAQNSEAPERFRGIGVRTEDDVLITATGCENLSAALPKSVAQIEQLMAQARASKEPLPA